MLSDAATSTNTFTKSELMHTECALTSVGKTCVSTLQRSGTRSNAKVHSPHDRSLASSTLTRCHIAFALAWADCPRSPSKRASAARAFRATGDAAPSSMSAAQPRGVIDAAPSVAQSTFCAAPFVGVVINYKWVYPEVHEACIDWLLTADCSFCRMLGSSYFSRALS